MEKKYLYLDDVRQPWETGNYMLPVDLREMYRKEKWEIVRTYDEFVAWINKNGLPDVISFDHDLAEIHYHAAIAQEEMRYLEHTGYHCAKWLCTYCLDNDLPLPEYYIHSMNPVGAENIQSYLDQFKRAHSGEVHKAPTEEELKTPRRGAGLSGVDFPYVAGDPFW